jgi:hypothetical protein
MKIFPLLIFSFLSFLSFSNLALSMEPSPFALLREGNQDGPRAVLVPEKSQEGGKKRKREIFEEDIKKDLIEDRKSQEEEISSRPLDLLPPEVTQHIFSYVCADPEGVKAWIPLMCSVRGAHEILKNDAFLNTQVFPFLSRKFLPIDAERHSTEYKLRVFDLGKKVKRLSRLGDDRTIGEFYKKMFKSNDNECFLHPYLMGQIRPLASLSKRLLEGRGEFYNNPLIRKIIKKVTSSLETRTCRQIN